MGTIRAMRPWPKDVDPYEIPVYENTKFVLDPFVKQESYLAMVPMTIEQVRKWLEMAKCDITYEEFLASLEKNYRTRYKKKILPPVVKVPMTVKDVEMWSAWMNSEERMRFNMTAEQTLDLYANNTIRLECEMFDYALEVLKKPLNDFIVIEKNSDGEYEYVLEDTLQKLGEAIVKKLPSMADYEREQVCGNADIRNADDYVDYFMKCAVACDSMEGYADCLKHTDEYIEEYYDFNPDTRKLTRKR